MSERPTQREVVFLDTNALHYLSLFIGFARDNGFTVTDIGHENLARRIDQEDETGYKISLWNGHKIVAFVIRTDAQIEFSHVSMVELLSGRIKGAAILNLAKEGVPERMWSTISEIEIRERSESDLPGIKARVGELPSVLNEWNIVFGASSAKNEAIDVLELAMEVVGLVYMSAADSIVYANAIAARADYLVTGDNYLRRTVNLIHNPSGSEQQRYQQIKQALQRLSGSELPQARNCGNL